MGSHVLILMPADALACLAYGRLDLAHTRAGAQEVEAARDVGDGMLIATGRDADGNGRRQCHRGLMRNP
jgi:hypothetical protein